MRISQRPSMTALTALALAMSGCGPEDKPAPVQVPTPLPSPVFPTPTPAPTTVTTGPNGERLAGMTVPGDLFGLLACSPAIVTTVEGHVTAIAGAPPPKIDNTINLNVTGGYVYYADVNGFGGSQFFPSQYRGGTAFATYRTAEAELQILKQVRSLNSPFPEFATLGLLSDPGLCFFAAYPRTSLPPPQSGQTQYIGLIDGVSQNGGDADRLIESALSVTSSGPGGNYTVAIEFRAVEQAFEDPSSQPLQELGKATGTMSFSNGQFSGQLTGPAGFSGTINGSVGGPLKIGAVFVFSLSDAQGNRIWGVAAADGARI